MYCDHIFIQILHDKRFVAYNEITPRRERERERKRKSKSRWHFLSFFLFFFGTMETRNTPLSLHYSVMSAPGRRAGRYRPSVAPLQAGLQFAAGQSLYNQTHSEWSVKLTHDEVSSHLHTHARTHTHLHLGQYSHTCNSTEWLITQKGKEVRHFNDIISWRRPSAASW